MTGAISDTGVRRRWAMLAVPAAMLAGGSALAEATAKEGRMLTEPKLEQRAEQPYVGIRSSVTLAEIGTVLPPLIGQVFAWLGERHASPAGAPFFRYRVTDMSGRMEVDVGVPVAAALAGDGRVIADSLPAGRYVTAIYTGNPAGLVAANGALQAWGGKNGIKWRESQFGSGTAWASRLEFYLTDPATEPDPDKWRTEIAYLTDGGKTSN